MEAPPGNRDLAGNSYDDLRYCAMGAVQKAARTSDQTAMAHLEKFTTRQKYDQVERCAGALAHVIEEQYPDFSKSLKNRGLGWKFGGAGVVELFNDKHEREEMLAIFEKALAKEDL